MTNSIPSKKRVGKCYGGNRHKWVEHQCGCPFCGMEGITVCEHCEIEK